MININIAIVDDQTLFRQTLSLLIKTVNDFCLVAEEASGADMLNRLSCMDIIPDILLMDMNMPEMDGVELSRLVREQFPKTKVIVLSMYAQESLISKMIISGASAYLVKNCDREELILAIRSTYQTGYYMNKQTLMAIQENNRFVEKMTLYSTIPVKLTERELEVLRLICDQYASNEIAEKLFISPRTVEGHRNHLLIKTESKNTAGLVLFAMKHRLITII